VPSSLPHHLTAPPLPDKKALVLLKERVDKAADPKTELDAIVKRIKGNTNRERLPSSTFSTFMHALRAMCVNALYCAARPPGVLVLRTPPSAINRGDLRLEEQLSVPCRSLPACSPPPPMPVDRCRMRIRMSLLHRFGIGCSGHGRRAADPSLVELTFGRVSSRTCSLY
jgi:hypothetical protein